MMKKLRCRCHNHLSLEKLNLLTINTLWFPYMPNGTELQNFNNHGIIRSITWCIFGLLVKCQVYIQEVEGLNPLNNIYILVMCVSTVYKFFRMSCYYKKYASRLVKTMAHRYKDHGVDPGWHHYNAHSIT